MKQSGQADKMADLSVQIKDGLKDYCSPSTWRRRFPFTIWLPKYKANYFIHDIIAGFTVGLTVIPQSLAYASVAKLDIVVSYIQGHKQRVRVQGAPPSLRPPNELTL